MAAQHDFYINLVEEAYNMDEVAVTVVRTVESDQTLEFIPSKDEQEINDHYAEVTIEVLPSTFEINSLEPVPEEEQSQRGLVQLGTVQMTSN
jgi:hypothetical protein